MIKTISSNEAKQQWGSLMTSVNQHGHEVIVESHGKPKVVVISYDEYQSVQELREKQRRADLVTRFRTMSERIGSRNSDLSEKQVEELANRFSHEFYEDLAREEKIRFERDIEK